MLRHKGNNRSYKHNLLLASTLSFIAGMVNIIGVLSVKTLTTNVTGHFAFFSEELVNENYLTSFIFLIYILFFLAGAFVSNILIEIMLRIKPRISHTIPIIIEIIILASIPIIFDAHYEQLSTYYHLIAFALLFAMGIQNSLVTKVSQSVVRTTHLTGIFTDLGIELSQLFFYRQANELEKLSRSIYLKLAIVFFFFSGCIIGGFLFKPFHLNALFLPAACLAVVLIYDNILYHFYFFKRKYFSK